MPRRSSAGLTFVLAASLCSLALLAGCTGSDDEGGAGTELTWFAQIQPGGSFQAIAQRCSEESDGRYTIQIELLPTISDQAREQLVRRLGAEDSTIDIIGMDVIWTAEFANAGWLLEWPEPQATEVTQDVFDSILQTASWEDKLYGAPLNSNTQVLWYRTDQIDQPPQTWDEMISQAQEAGSTIQVQANRYEGFTVWVNYMIESAGGQILSGPEEVDLPEGPTEDALATIGRYANSAAAPPDIDTSTEDSARRSFEAGASAFQLNYTFALGSATANAPDIAENMGSAKLPAVVDGMESRPPLGGFNLGVSAYSENSDLAFEAAACLASEQSQLTMTELDGLPPSRETLYGEKVVQDAYPGFSEEVRRSIADAAPRPQTPAYTDLSLAIQRALHPPADIDPDDPTPTYDELRDKVEDAVKREGLL